MHHQVQQAGYVRLKGVGLGVWRVDAGRHCKNPHQMKEQGWIIQRSPSYRGASVRIQVISMAFRGEVDAGSPKRATAQKMAGGS
jgi:hypothetical protein